MSSPAVPSRVTKFSLLFKPRKNFHHSTEAATVSQTKKQVNWSYTVLFCKNRIEATIPIIRTCPDVVDYGVQQVVSVRTLHYKTSCILEVEHERSRVVFIFRTQVLHKFLRSKTAERLRNPEGKLRVRCLIVSSFPQVPFLRGSQVIRVLLRATTSKESRLFRTIAAKIAHETNTFLSTCSTETTEIVAAVSHYQLYAFDNRRSTLV